MESRDSKDRIRKRIPESSNNKVHIELLPDRAIFLQDALSQFWAFTKTNKSSTKVHVIYIL